MSKIPTSALRRSVQPFRLSRRAFLGGSTVAISLPFLEAMLPGRSARAAGSAPPRFLGFYVPNGIHMASWTPQQAGPGYDLPPTLAPLAPLQSKISVISNLANAPAEPETNGSHATGTASFLTCMPIQRSETDLKNGTSLDQLHAANQAGQTRLASLQLAGQGLEATGACAQGFSCAYSRSISWADDRTPLSKFSSTELAFEYLFGGSDPSGSAEQAAQRRADRKSVLDYVTAQTNDLKSRLGQPDKQKLDEYLTGVRELETRIDAEEMAPACDASALTTDWADIEGHAHIMLDMIVLAMQCDLTRAFTFMLDQAGSSRNYSFIGVNGGHHDISHHGNDPVKFAQLETINTWEVERLMYLLQRMDAITDAQGGTLLDNSLVFFSAGISDGNRHLHYDLPVLLAGTACGNIGAGHHIVAPDRTPLANLHLATLQALGGTQQSFGADSTGPLTLPAP